MNCKKSKLVVLVALAALFFVVCSSQAWASFTWDGSQSTSWTGYRNWTPEPASSWTGTTLSDTIIINKVTTQPVTGNNANFSVGTLTLGTSDTTLLTISNNAKITVYSDYTNANWGTGNGFTPYQRIIKGNGNSQLLAYDAGQQITGGANLTGGATTNATLALGSLRVGDAATTANYQIYNSGTTTSIRGAIQTSGNGNITDTNRLTGTGVQTVGANFGPIIHGALSSIYAVTFNPTTAGALTGQKVYIINNFDNVTDQTLNITGAAYRTAIPLLNTTTLNLGAVRVDDASPTGYISVTNSVTNSDIYSEGLKVTLGAAPAHFTNTGSLSNLGANSTNSNTLRVGLNTSTAGNFSGSQGLNLSSTGVGTSGLADLGLTGQNVTLNGKVYQPAGASFSSATIDFGTVRVGENVAPKSLTVTNTATSAGLNDVLIGTFSGGSLPFTTGGNLGDGLAPGTGSSTSLHAQLTTVNAGAFNGTATLALQSHNADMTDLSLVNTPITLTGTVNNWANPVFKNLGTTGTLSGSGTLFTLDLGTFTQGTGTISASLGLKNDALAPADWLNGSFTQSGTSPFILSGFTTFSQLSAGDTKNLSVGLSTTNSGDFSYSIFLNALSGNASDLTGTVVPGLQDGMRLDVLGRVNAPSVPIPSTFWLIGTGLVAFIAIRRRRGSESKLFG